MTKDHKDKKKTWDKIAAELQKDGIKQDKAKQAEAMEDFAEEISEETIEVNESNDNAGILEHPSYIILEEQLTAAEQKAHENWEKATRALAELENVRRRAERDVSNAHRYGIEKLLTALLPVVDSLEQALQLSQQETANGMQEGLQLTLKLFLDVLEKNGIQFLNPEGELFNPQEHEAMSMQETSDMAPNTVLAVFQKGCKLYERIIRPARVIVAKASSNTEKI